MAFSMQFASCFLHGFVALESQIQLSSQGGTKRYVATVPVPEFDCFVGSIEYEILDSAVSNDNLEASVSLFIPLNMKPYVPGNIIYVSGKIVALPDQSLVMDANIHLTHVALIPYRHVCTN
jgi:hypothetical protein